MRCGLLLLILIAVLALPGGASAAAGDAAGVDVAMRTWGRPACGVPVLEISTPEAYLDAHGTGAFDVDPLAWADDDRCVIVINQRAVIHTAAKRCHVIVHEWGHLAGYRDPSNTGDPEHSSNPRSVMYARDEVDEGRVRVKRRWRWEATGAFRPCVAATDPGTSIG